MVTVLTAQNTRVRQDYAALAAFCAAGCAMLAFVAGGPWIIRTGGYQVFIPAVAASGLITLWATSLAPRIPRRTGLLIILGLALAMRLLLVYEEPFLSTDLYRYIWDGRVQAAGINPYIYVPADPALAALRDTAIYPHINRADYLVTAYPPVAQMFFLLATRIAETTAMLRLAMVGCEVVIVAVVIDLLRRLDLPVTSVVAYAWHPLAIWEISNNGHVETLMVTLLMLGVWLLVRSYRIAAAVAVALAIIVKPYAVIVMPAFWRPWDWRVPLAIIAAIVACYLPYLGAGRGVSGSIAPYVAEEGLATGVGIWLIALAQLLFGKTPALAAIYFAIAAGTMLWLGVRIAFGSERTPHETISAITLLLTAGLFLISPNYAWYYLALVPLIPLGAGATAWALTLGGFLLYRPIWLPYENDLVWKSLATLPFVITLALIVRGRVLARSQRESAWTT